MFVLTITNTKKKKSNVVQSLRRLCAYMYTFRHTFTLLYIDLYNSSNILLHKDVLSYLLYIKVEINTFFHINRIQLNRQIAMFKMKLFLRIQFGDESKLFIVHALQLCLICVARDRLRAVMRVNENF